MNIKRTHRISIPIPKLTFTLGLAVVLLVASACASELVTSSSTTTTQPSTITSSSQPDSDTTASPSGEVNVAIATTTPPPASSSTTTTATSPSSSQPTTSATTTTFELAEAAFTSRSKVTTVGIDEIFFGAWYQDAEAAARTEWVGIPDGTIPECLVVTPINGPEGVDVWLFRGFVERIDLTNADIRTRSGYGLGTELETLVDNLGEQLEIVENEDGYKTATFVPVDESDAAFRIVFELDSEDEVTSYRSGRASLINRAKDTCG